MTEDLLARQDLWVRIADADSPTGTRVAGGDDWEAWVQGFAPGHSSGPHRHGPAGVLAVLSGQLTEWTEATEALLVAGDRHAYSAGYLHDLRNSGPEVAVTLHIVGHRLADQACA